ncbi:motility associated factor glycosyltransferase family protein [Tepidibacter sp. Z1-5]|uniref:motility associated factor glycosyltransferase family protein n=1 Tax=Tepidibacter sp. Z1-5 TaxID=3134138 RepID=UPI0030BAB2F6
MDIITKESLNKLNDYKYEEGIKIDFSKDEKSINKFISCIGKINIDTLIIVFGLGTGEHILKLMDNIGKFNNVLIIEPDIRIFNAFCKLEYANQILEDKRISLFLFDEKSLEDTLIYFISESQYDNLIYLDYGNYVDLYIDEYKFFLKSLKNALFLQKTNVITEKVHKDNFFKAYINNIKHITRSQSINFFKDTLKGLPAIIVSAGPSLEKNIDRLKYIKDDFVIICANRTFSSLIERGIKPNFVCSIDCKDGIYEMMKTNINSDVPLVFTETSNIKLMNEYKGKKIFFKNAAIDTMVDRLINTKIDSLYAGGSVAHTCTDFAVHLGCNPVIFIGQDFAYTNKKQYASMTKTEIDIEYNEFIEVEDINGEKVLTTYFLDNFRKLMEDYIHKTKDVLFINSTEGGANINGTKVMDLKNALNQYKKDLTIGNKIFNTLEKKNNIDKNLVKLNLYKILDELTYLKNRLNEGLEYCKEILQNEDTVFIKNLLLNIYKINNEIENKEELDFINFLTLDVFNDAAKKFRYIEEKDENSLEGTKKLIIGFEYLYRNLLIEIEKSIPLIKVCIKEVK